MKRKVVLFCLLMLASFWAGWFVKGPVKTDRAIELENAFPYEVDRDCVPATADELARYEFVVRALDVFGSGGGDAMSIGAHDFLAWNSMYRRVGDRSFQVCPPDGLYAGVATIMAEHELWRYRQTESGLRLATRIGQGRPEIVEAVAKIAFSEYPEFGEIFSNKDLRPFARTVLAGLGPSVSSYGDIAFAQMSSDDSLEQIAFCWNRLAIPTERVNLL